MKSKGITDKELDSYAEAWAWAADSSHKIEMINTATDLREQINARYPSSRAFVVAFNAATGINLNETTLSRQLSGRVALSGFALAAYRLFFDRIAE